MANIDTYIKTESKLIIVWIWDVPQLVEHLPSTRETWILYLESYKLDVMMVHLPSTEEV